MDWSPIWISMKTATLSIIITFFLGVWMARLVVSARSEKVKMVLDGLIDTLNMNINKGFSVQLGDFGCFRPGLNAKSQDKEEDVKSDTVYRRKIIFTPGQQFKEMLTRASVTRAGWDNSEVVSGGGSNPGTGGNGEEEENPLG